MFIFIESFTYLYSNIIAGWVYDIIGTYDLSFYLAGIFISLSGLLLLVLPAIEFYKRYSALKIQKAADKTYQVQTQVCGFNDITLLTTWTVLNILVYIYFQEISVENKSNGTTILSDCFGQKDLLAEVVKV